MKKGAMWPIGVAAILAATVGANIWVMVVANGDPSFAIEKDYYRRAIDWDATMAQERHNAALGWRLTPEVGAIFADGATLVVTLTDSAGAPLRDATMRVAAAHNARAGDVLEVTLPPRAGAGYAATLPMHRPGQWELRFEVTRGGERFTAVRRVDVPAAHRT
jgi:nitrogen fixation protein FixH